MFFDSASDVGRVLAVGIAAYGSLVVALRLAGSRTLAKLNAFDLVVTVALGSTLATIMLSSDVSLVEGVCALVLLSALQFAVTWSSVRSRALGRAVRSQPALLLADGELLGESLRRHRVTAGEVRQAIRASGSGAVDDIAAVVLETDGSMSVIRRSRLGSASALDDVADPTGASTRGIVERGGAS